MREGGGTCQPHLIIGLPAVLQSLMVLQLPCSRLRNDKQSYEPTPVTRFPHLVIFVQAIIGFTAPLGPVSLPFKSGFYIGHKSMSNNKKTNRLPSSHWMGYCTRRCAHRLPSERSGGGDWRAKQVCRIYLPTCRSLPIGLLLYLLFTQ